MAASSVVQDGSNLAGRARGCVQRVSGGSGLVRGGVGRARAAAESRAVTRLPTVGESPS
jgi:hypothetical protein